MDSLSKAERTRRLEAWVAQYGEAVLRLCFALLRDRHLAEDATQETFFKAWRGMSGFARRQNCSDKTWLMRIAINVCRDFSRTPWRRHVDLAQAIGDLPPAALAVTDEDRLLFLDVLRLPEKYRQVVLLCDVQAMTLEEAAHALSIPRSTAHHRLQRAHALLRQTLERSDAE